MKKRNSLPSIRMTLLCSVLSANVAMAGNPVVCTANYYDATCNGRIVAPYQTPPSCSTGPGWTTLASAQWQGSHFSSPQCNYQPPPTCPNGFDQTSAPSWNGSSWVGLGCAPHYSSPTEVAGSPSLVTVYLVTWFPAYGPAWYGEGTMLAKKHTYTDGSVQYSVLLQSGGDLSWGNAVRAYPTHQTLSGMPIFAGDAVCTPSSYNGENGPVSLEITGGLIMQPAAYGGPAANMGQCAIDMLVPGP